MSRPSANDLYKAAKGYIREGQPIFPCKASGPKAKAPATKHGVKDATVDRDKIKMWLREMGSDVALGIATGVVWDVLDVDVKREEDGRVHLPYLQRLGLLNGCKRVVKTPSGGWHLYFKASPGLTNRASAGLGLDVRTTGGYVLAPPSFITTEDYSGFYEDHGETSNSTDDPLRWDLIRSVLAPVNSRTKQPVELLGYERRASLASLKGWLSERIEGERNTSLHWAACRCIDNGLDPHELVEVATIALGLPEDEVLLTINSALRRAGVTTEDLDSEAEAMFGSDE